MREVSSALFGSEILTGDLEDFPALLSARFSLRKISRTHRRRKRVSRAGNAEKSAEKDTARHKERRRRGAALSPFRRDYLRGRGGESVLFGTVFCRRARSTVRRRLHFAGAVRFVPCARAGFFGQARSNLSRSASRARLRRREGAVGERKGTNAGEGVSRRLFAVGILPPRLKGGRASRVRGRLFGKFGGALGPLRQSVFPREQKRCFSR